MLDVVPADPLSSRSWIGEEAVEHNGRLFVSSLDLLLPSSPSLHLLIQCRHGRSLRHSQEPLRQQRYHETFINPAWCETGSSTLYDLTTTQTLSSFNSHLHTSYVRIPTDILATRVLKCSPWMACIIDVLRKRTLRVPSWLPDRGAVQPLVRVRRGAGQHPQRPVFRG
jgi:hypothetical protein